MLRRDFLTLMGTGAASGVGCNSAIKPAVAPHGGPVDRWQNIRAEFELEPNKTHLAGLFLASHPRPVREAIEAHRRGFDRNPIDYLHSVGFGHDAEIRKVVVSYTGGEPEEIALTDSTTMGLGLLYSGLKLSPQDDILQTTHEHFVSDTALAALSERSGAWLRKVALYEDGAQATAGSLVERLVSQIVPETRVVAVTWVHSSTGVKLPLRAMADAIATVNRNRSAERRVLFCVDGVHGFGVEDVKIPELGCDFFSAGCHKWLFGPRGTGLLWGRRNAWGEVRPSIPALSGAGFGRWIGTVTSTEPIPFGELMTPGGFHSFEHRWALPQAFQFHLELGKAKIQARIHALCSELKAGLSELKHVRLHTPLAPELSAGIVCFEIPGKEPEAIIKTLHEQNIIGSTTPYRVSYARFTPGSYNTSEEIQTAIRAVAAMRG